MAVEAQKWTTYFAYNNVEQIALGADCVYALSDGSLFSVDKQTEQIKLYNNRSGLHGTGITVIHYDASTQSLLIAYKNGKIEVLSDHGVRYVGDLYDKDMTQRKTIYNITIHNKTAYLSTHYGVQTMDLREHKLVDSYWLLPGGLEKPIYDVKIEGDSIYAFGADSMFCAKMSDNVVDYTVWRREKLTGRVTPDATKGKYYKDGTNDWYAGGAEGVVRGTPAGKFVYKPEGPLNNIPYRLAYSQGSVYMLQGGRWDAQYWRPGMVMRHDGEHWTNIPNDKIQPNNQEPALDFMNVAVDPKDKHHYYVTSYGTGLYEFYQDTLVRHYLPAEDNTLSSSAANDAPHYTRLDCATYDKDNNLWMMCTAANPYLLVCMDAQKEWHGLRVKYEGQPMPIYTPAALIMDHRNAHYKWTGAARYNTCVVLMDDGGTPFDDSDDRVMKRSQWQTQDGKIFEPKEIQAMMQDSRGRIWLGTEQGVVYIAPETDFFESGSIVVPELMDHNGENPLSAMRIYAICEDSQGRIWIGSESLGVYVLDADASQIVAQYTTENSAMPSNTIMSMVCADKDVMYIGTSEGLVSIDENAQPEGIDNTGNEAPVDYGTMQQWKLHYSYVNPQVVEVSGKHIYAVSDGVLYSVNRETEELEYWNKSTGLNGTNISKIAYDKQSGQLVISYLDGRIDLLTEDGAVRQVPDLYMKSSSISPTINQIYPGSRYTYLAMSYGVLAINPRKAEISETYYIGDEAANVEVKQIVELGDSLYAFSDDRIYSAALNDNLVDYVYWKSAALPKEGLRQAFVYEDRLYIVASDILFSRQHGGWVQMTDVPIAWARAYGGQLLVERDDAGLYRLMDDGTLAGINNIYRPKDAIYLDGYWLCVETVGLVKLVYEGTIYYQPECPLTNYGYRLYPAHDRMYVTSGGRWADLYGRWATVSIYHDKGWKGIPFSNFAKLGDIRDAVSVAVDNNDPGHFFVATYAGGVIEFKDYDAVTRYDSRNSTIREAAEPIEYYTRTDGAKMDDQNNLWVLSSTRIGSPVHVRTPEGRWYALNLYSQGETVYFITPGDMHIDNRRSNYKWMCDQRYAPGVILLDDNGTPTYGGDDRSIKRNSFVDQDGKPLTPENIYCMEQDLNGRMWIGTEAGIIVIPNDVDFFTSNSCRRIIIPRNDGTNLADYLLGNEQVNCMAVDGGNRMWIGTATSGLYLMEDDTITIAHFTTENSLLPSNSIQSVAIMRSTGEVFVGTDNGIVSYRSDASAPKEDLKQAYAFPNPVRPNYSGVVSIAGLMEKTDVNIIDESGNLICKTRSHGGIAVWDGKTADGMRAKPGVYTALCNAPDGSHGVVKILIMR